MVYLYCARKEAGRSGFARAKSELAQAHVHLNVFKACGLEAGREGGGLDHDHGVEQMQQAKGRAVAAIPPRCSAGEGTWCSMVKQTAESNSPSGSDAAATSSDWTAAERAAAECRGESGIHFHAGQARDPAAQQIVAPYPGPSSRTFDPRSRPSSVQGRMRDSTLRFQRGEEQSRRCRRFTCAAPDVPRCLEYFHRDP